MFDNRNALAEQNAVRGSRQVGRVVDVVRVDADERGAFVQEKLRGGFSEERMALEIPVGSPMLIPTRVNQHGSALYFQTFEITGLDRSLLLALSSEQHAIQVRDRLQFKLRQIISLRVTMKRSIELSAGIRHHFDLADLKFRAFAVVLPRLFPAQKITNNRRGQAFVSDEAVLDRVTEIDEISH